MMKIYQRGSTAVAALIVIVMLMFSVAAVALFSYVSANNYGASIEAQLNSLRDNNQNVLAQGQQKVMEAAQVPSMYKDDFKEIITADVQGRYGKDGSKATFQWLKEHDVNIDAELYRKIQQLIESYRDEFKNSQTRMIDVRRQYEASLGFFWRGMWLRLAGFPKLNINDFKPIVTDNVEQVYKEGKEHSSLQLRSQK